MKLKIYIPSQLPSSEGWSSMIFKVPKGSWLSHGAGYMEVTTKDERFAAIGFSLSNIIGWNLEEEE